MGQFEQKILPYEVLLATVLESVDDHLGVEEDESTEHCQSQIKFHTSQQTHSEQHPQHAAPEHDVQGGHQKAPQVQQGPMQQKQEQSPSWKLNYACKLSNINRWRFYQPRVDTHCAIETIKYSFWKL